MQRSNTEGRLELLLKSYSFGGKWYPHIPRDETIAGKRRLLVECDVKAIGADHTLRFVVKDPKGGSWLAEYRTIVSGNSWSHLTGLLEIDATLDSSYELTTWVLRKLRVASKLTIWFLWREERRRREAICACSENPFSAGL